MEVRFLPGAPVYYFMKKISAFLFVALVIFFGYQLIRSQNNKDSPSGPSLTSNTWEWVALNAAGKNLEAQRPTYTMEFLNDGTVNLKVDCNSASGTYLAEGSNLTIEIGPMTLAYCGEDSQDTLFLNSLSQVTNYSFRQQNLILGLVTSFGKMSFSPVK